MNSDIASFLKHNKSHEGDYENDFEDNDETIRYESKNNKDALD